jgi:hypothetical protein
MQFRPPGKLAEGPRNLRGDSLQGLPVTIRDCIIASRDRLAGYVVAGHRFLTI